MITTPTIEVRPDQPYVARRSRVAMPELGPVIERGIAETGAWLGQRGLEPADAPFVRYRVVNMAGQLDVEVGFPVAASQTGDGRVEAGVLPGGRYATLLYTGPYDGLMAANAALLDWGAQNGHAWDMRATPEGDAFGARLESYLTNPAVEPDSSKWRTVVAIRLADE